MISIIVSSINTEQNLIFKKNIEETIGTPYELLIHDNRELQWGLCKIYNHYALISKYNILCFFHEDTRLQDISWGCIISDFFQQTPIAGVVGFAGSTIKTRQLSGWGSRKETSRENIIQHFKENKVKYLKCNPHNETFSPVAVIDGLAMITTKKIWEQCNISSIIKKQSQVIPILYKLKLIKHIIKAGGKKLHKSIQHQTKLSNQKVKYGK